MSELESTTTNDNDDDGNGNDDDSSSCYPNSVVMPITSDPALCNREWVVLELNGEILPPTELPTTTADQPTTSVPLLGPDQVELGSLSFHDDDNKTPVMILGSHELKGKVQHLKEPFCVLEKKRRGGEDAANSSTDNANVQYGVVGVVTKKLLFNNYPKTIMK